MPMLPHTHLLTLVLDVGFSDMTVIGPTPDGLRRIAPVTGGRFEGPRLRGSVIGGADWVVNRPDTAMVVDVRLTLKTDDGAAIYLAYGGRFLAKPDAMARFGKGALLDPSEYSLVIQAKFSCGHGGHDWLNDVIAVGVGRQTSTGAVYEIFSIGSDPTDSVK